MLTLQGEEQRGTTTKNNVKVIFPDNSHVASIIISLQRIAEDNFHGFKLEI